MLRNLAAKSSIVAGDIAVDDDSLSPSTYTPTREGPR
jgi:hypothetical protein